MQSNFRSKLQDIINSSFSEKLLNKSQTNLLIYPESTINNGLKTSYSSSKYNNLSSNYYSKNTENFKDKLNRSYTELGIIRKPKNDSSNKKYIFDNIDNSISYYFGNDYINDFDYENVFNNINRRNKKETNNILHGNIINNNLFNINKLNCNKLKRQNSSNNFQLRKKIYNFTNELRYNSNLNTLLLNKPISRVNKNIGTYSSPFSNGRTNNLIKGNKISKLFNYDTNSLFKNQNFTSFDSFGSYYNNNRKINNLILKNDKNYEVNQYLNGFNINNYKGRNIYKNY